MPKDELDILLITNGMRENRGDARNNRKLIEILLHISGSLHLITFVSKDLIPILPKERIIELKTNKNNLFQIIYTQLAVFLNILRIGGRNRINSIVFACGMDLQMLPMIAGKIVSRNTVIRSDGRPSLVYKRYYPRHTLIPRILFKLIEEVNYRLANHVLTECRYMIEDNKFGKYSASVGSLFVDGSFFQHCMPLAARRYDLGFVGKLNARKGVLKFLQAFDHARGELRLVVVGDGDLKSQVSEKISQLTTQDASKGMSIDFYEWIEDEQLPNLIGDIKLLVLPSVREGLPNTMLEAMASGTIVLTSSVGGIPGVVIDGKTGFILQDKSPESIAKRISEVLNREDLESISMNASELIKEEFSFEKAVNLWNDYV